MTRSRGYRSTGARADFSTVFSTVDRIEYVVRPRGDIWLIERDGDEYGPYKNGREALFFAIDAAHKFGELGRRTHVRQMDQAGQPLSTWTYGTDPYPPFF
jgi:hypothetical protein